MVPMMAHQEVRFLEFHLRESLVDPSEVSLMVPMMSHHRVTFTGLTHGDFLRPAQIWIVMRCGLHAPAVAESVLSTNVKAEKVATGQTNRAVRRD